MNNTTTGTKHHIDQIFSDEYVRRTCFDLWTAHIKWLKDLGFDRADESLIGVAPVQAGHEVVDLLSEFVAGTGLVNAHLGLTSSDIIDNVRLIQVRNALSEIRDAIEFFIIEFTPSFDAQVDTTGFTHWQPAAPISWSHRLGAWISPLDTLCRRVPEIHAKKFGGAVGDGASLELIVPEWRMKKPFDWETFDLAQPCNHNPLQSSDYVDEMAAIGWVCAVAAQLHKIAQDLRFLASRGSVQIHPAKTNAGSSSMPHKVNPYKWEKVCSICRSVSTTQQEVWDVMAHNSMERTLDGSWQIKQLLHRAFGGLAYAFDEMRGVRCSINFLGSQRELESMRDIISSDRDLTRRVVQGGESRWTAYLDMINQKNQRT